MVEIQANAKKVRDLLGGKKYTIDYFQREYRWGQKQISELVNDLTSSFLTEWRPGHGRDKVASYPAYFLGSVIVSSEGGSASVIDGQQRLTSLSLLLIWVMKGLEDEDRQQVSNLVFTRVFGANAYNLDVPERTPAMDALYKGEPYNRDAAPESVRNILDRYDDIDDLMPATIATIARAMFADWLMERVFLVEIASPTDDDGYAIFETMNDRGLPLSPSDMLKSHLLANVSGADARQSLNGLWKARINELVELGKEEDSDAIKSWLRAQHAETIRLREANAKPGDFDRISTEFHRWVRDYDAPSQAAASVSAANLHLTSSADFERFVREDFEFYTRWYARLRRAAIEVQPGREAIYINADSKFNLQYPVMLAALTPTDDEETGWRKALVAASFIETMLARRQWNQRGVDSSTLQYSMFLVIKEIRGKSAVEAAEVLKGTLERDVAPFSANPRFGLHQTNKKAMRRLLARMQAWVDSECGITGSFPTYMQSSGSKGYDIEHVVANQHDRHREDFPDVMDFDENRNRIGGLLLLPKSFNRSYGDMAYEDKVEHYNGQHQLARTLGAAAYDNNPGLQRIIDIHGVPFRPLDHFGKSEIETRQAAIVRLAEVVWDPNRLDALASGELK
ncbi:MAG: hypothetical protein ABS75_07970 [Pelagibacterium sp. SCN 63-23]|nr:MAG: hypothetical protein ABS75_07970 [Pelagibacterium sp. SCN 63-23]